ncbi:hypothetical protein SUGI_0429330 [Cryptomeria japonica]|nr:hypothetical protein SUGI_0429330 [Cryptomeria japonica]
MICGSRSEKKRDRRPKKVRPQPCESGYESYHSADSGYETASPHCWMGNDENDVDKATDDFIHTFRKDLKLQRSLSDAQYNGYLERAK